MHRVRTPSRRELAVALLVTTLVLCAVAWWWPSPLEVETTQVVLGPLEVTVDNEGETRSRDRFSVCAPVSGRLLRLEVRAGDAVQQGQALGWMAPLPLTRRERDEALARVTLSEAVLREARERWRQAVNAAEQARRDHARIAQLVQQAFMSPQAEEQAATALTHARQEELAAQSRVEAAGAEVQLARVGLTAEDAATRSHPAEVPVKPVMPVVIRAPSTGHVLSVPDPSERVLAAGTPLLTLGRLQGLEVAVDVLSSEAVRIRPGMSVIVEGWGREDALRAVVRTVEPYAWTKVSTLGVEEKRARVLADFVEIPQGLGDGFRVMARVVVWSADPTLKVDTGALFRCGQAWCVFVVDGGRATRREVTLGPRNALEAQVLSGLQAHEVVIRFPGNQVAEGIRVRSI